MLPKYRRQHSDGPMASMAPPVRASNPAADSANGGKLFADYGCNACHAIRKKGGKPQFPDLADEAKAHDGAWLDRWLKDPAALKKGTFMARSSLTQTQRHALVEYISLAREEVKT